MRPKATPSNPSLLGALAKISVLSMVVVEIIMLIHEPLHSGHNHICILQHNLCQDPLNPLSSNVHDTIVGWYRDLLLGGNHSTDSTGLENQISAAYHGIYPSTIQTTHNLLINKNTCTTPSFPVAPNDCLFYGFATIGNSFGYHVKQEENYKGSASPMILEIGKISGA